MLSVLFATETCYTIKENFKHFLAEAKKKKNLNCKAWLPQQFHLFILINK